MAGPIFRFFLLHLVINLLTAGTLLLQNNIQYQLALSGDPAAPVRVIVQGSYLSAFVSADMLPDFSYAFSSTCVFHHFHRHPF